MPRKLPLSDFRSRRTRFLREDFAYAPKPMPRPSDVIGKGTWDSIVALPDDVAVRTSNYHGTTLEQLDGLWGAWVESYGNKRDHLFEVMLDAGDDFQAATYVSLTGFYRLSVTAMRSALELVTIGAWAQICGKKNEFEDWRAGRTTLSLGRACDGLVSGARSLEQVLLATVNDTLFAQTSSLGGGFVRRIFSGVSDFAHARPGSTDGDMRESNGPIYVGSAFKHVTWIYFEVLGLCFTLVMLARPKMPAPKAILNLIADTNRLKSRVTRAAFQELNKGR
jgi:hypothetical protein